MRLMRSKDIRAARRRSKGEIVEKSRKKELKKLAAQRQRDAFEKSLPMSRAEFGGYLSSWARAWRIATATACIGSRWSFCEPAARRTRRQSWTFASKTAGIATAKF